MPELPEVEATRAFARRHCCGKKVKSAEVQEDTSAHQQNILELLQNIHSSAIRTHGAVVNAFIIQCADLSAEVFKGKEPDEIQNFLEGHKISSVERKGKHFWYVNIKHSDEWPPRFTKLELTLEDDTRVALTDGRRFAKVFTSADPLNEPPISELGKDSYTELPEEQAFCEMMSAQRRSIKAVLLDQGVLCGIGNWVADEVLYQAKLYPEMRACDLEEEEMKSLRTAIKDVLAKAVEVDADAARLPTEWLFHYRWTGKLASKDVNGEEIKFIKVGGRTTAYVPSLQLKKSEKGKAAAKAPAAKKAGGSKKAGDTKDVSNEDKSEECGEDVAPVGEDEGDESTKQRASKRRVATPKSKTFKRRKG